MSSWINISILYSISSNYYGNYINKQGLILALNNSGKMPGLTCISSPGTEQVLSKMDNLVKMLNLCRIKLVADEEDQFVG